MINRKNIYMRIGEGHTFFRDNELLLVLQQNNLLENYYMQIKFYILLCIE